MTQQRSNDEIRYAIVGEWLVEETGECTCGTGGMDGHGHERGCGQEPIYKVDELLANYRAQSARAERAEAQVQAVESILVEFVSVRGDFYEPVPLMQMIKRLRSVLGIALRTDWRPSAAAGLSLQEEQE